MYLLEEKKLAMNMMSKARSSVAYTYGANFSKSEGLHENSAAKSM